MFVMPVYKGVPHYNFFNTAKKNLETEIKKKNYFSSIIVPFFMNKSVRIRNIC